MDDAISALVNFDNGSLGRLEASRFGIGFKNRNAFEIHGAGGMLRFNLENLNRLARFAGHRHEAPDFP